MRRRALAAFIGWAALCGGPLAAIAGRVNAPLHHPPIPAVITPSFDLQGVVLDAVLLSPSASLHSASEEPSAARCADAGAVATTVFLRLPNGESVPVVCAAALACECWLIPVGKTVAVSGTVSSMATGLSGGPEDLVPMLVVRSIVPAP